MNSPNENMPEVPKNLRRICPFLGVLEDPETSLGFPSEMNYCHAAEPPGVPRFDQQLDRCLSLTYLGCPVYSAQEKGPLPKDIRLGIKGGGVPIKIQSSWLVRTIGAFIIATLIFFIGWFGVSGLTRSINESSAAKTQANLPILSTPTPLPPSPTRTALPSPYLQASPVVTETPTPPLVSTLNPGNPPTNCGRPAGWRVYTVRSGDTLYELSLTFGVTVSQLQSVNCLGTSTVLHVGRTLYVPPGASIPVYPSLEPTWPMTTFVPTDTLAIEPTTEFVPFVTGTPIVTENPTTGP